MEHQAQDDMNNGHNNQGDPPAQNNQDNLLEEDDGDMPGWGHWAMPADEDDDFIDQEVEEGEFMALADLLQPLDEQHQVDLPVMDNHSEITLFVGSNEIAQNNVQEEGLH